MTITTQTKNRNHLKLPISKLKLLRKLEVIYVYPIFSATSTYQTFGRMMKWSLELSEFDIHYESKKALKVLVFADFVAEMTFPAEENKEGIWIVYVNESSN